MIFSSLEFLLLFLPGTLIVHFLLPRKLRNYWLLLASLFFYAWGEPTFVLIMIASVCFNYLLALGIDRSPQQRTRKLLLVLDIVLNLGILLVFKYLNFLTSTLHSLIPGTVSLFPATSIALPIGISFFTFQALSYVVDVYRHNAKAERNIAFVGLYISLFPQLIAGPIVRYTTIMDQIRERKITLSGFSDGMIRFMIGFNKKVLLANVLATVADTAFKSNGGSVSMAWLGALCYTLQIYFDFSGYSDMAIGLGRMLGFRFLENFDHPYISCTVTEFWRRWHISLGTWFRDYVYFPLGGSRVSSKLRLVRNLLVVWLLTGIWHGANWTFILWGVLYGVVIIVEKLAGIPKKLPSWPVVCRVLYRIVTILIVMLGWVLFRADDLPKAGAYLQTMFGLGGAPLVADDFIFNVREYAVYWAAGILCSVPVLQWLQGRLQRIGGRTEAVLTQGAQLVQLVLFVVSVTMLVMNAHNPFIYFNF